MAKKKKIIYQDSVLVSGIMCHIGCGAMIQHVLSDLDGFKNEELLPDDAKLILDAEPQGLGIHRLLMMVESETKRTELNDKQIAEKFRENIINMGFEIIDENGKKTKDRAKIINWANILINIASFLTILILSFVFPPSIPLTIGLAALSFLTTAFAARQYLFNFIKNFKNKSFANMATTISLGCFLALGHMIFHAVTMPLTGGLSMIFMSYLMPILLIGIINVMDEIKRIILNRSKNMQLKGMKAIFPQMADEYECYELSPIDQDRLAQQIMLRTGEEEESEKLSILTQEILTNTDSYKQKKMLLNADTVIRVPEGACFPVDGIIVDGQSLVDTSILNGESQEHKKPLDFIPAGAINLGKPVKIMSTTDCYNSTINKLLFRSNRAAEESKQAKFHRIFSYVYTALIMISMAAAVFMPLALGIFTLPLIIQNVIGVLFSVCFCTLTIAHQLPKLLSIYRRYQSGISLRNENLTEPTDEIHTIVFDKTGTITTGNSQVDFSEGISPSLWQSVYLLEREHGNDHPLAKAITHFYETNNGQLSLIKDIKNFVKDVKYRGLSAVTQGKLLHVGSADYFERSGIKLPTELSSEMKKKLALGYTLVHVAENKVYKGTIAIKHEVRQNIITSIKRFKELGIKIILSSGDSKESVLGFNKQNGNIFDELYAEQTPQDKEDFLKKLMEDKTINPKGIWFIGDGLNDAPCARMVSEKGGISCAMTQKDKASFFTDLSLNGSLAYLFVHNKINRFLTKNIRQNQGVMAYSAFIFLAFIITFSCMGLAVPPLIPMVIMVSTSLLTIFNSYRAKLSVDTELKQNNSWLKQYMASDLSLGLLIGAASFLVCAVLITTIMTGGLALPVISFTAGAVTALSSTCFISSGLMFGLFGFLGALYLTDKLDPAVEFPATKTLMKEQIDTAEVNLCDNNGTQMSFFSELKENLAIDSPSPEYHRHFLSHEACSH